jgi:hypothetical protein
MGKFVTEYTELAANKEFLTNHELKGKTLPLRLKLQH